MADPLILRPVVTDDLPRLLAWRNHPAVRAAMFSQHEITLREHQAWFLRMRDDPDRCLLTGSDSDDPCGFVQFSAARQGGIAAWGFYARPGAPRGTGTRLCAAALSYAFDQLQLHKVCGEVIAENAPSLALHRRLGFTQEGVLREQKPVNDSYHSLVCFGLLRREWHGTI